MVALLFPGSSSGDTPAEPLSLAEQLGSASTSGAAAPPAVPSGRERRWAERPATLGLPACSFERPICVHAVEGVPALAVERTLDAAEHALFALEALNLPRPSSDGARGGSPAFDIYVVPEAPPHRVRLDDVAPLGFDSATTFLTVTPPGDGCAGSAAIARALATAGLLRIDAATNDGVMAMVASHFAALAAPCPSVELTAVDMFQRHPERSLVSADADGPVGAMLFSRYLDQAYGTGRPVDVLSSLVAVAVQQSPPDAWHWHNEPDVFDALRRNARSLESSLSNLLLDFSVQRAFMGDRSDGAHLADVARYGEAGRVRFEWNVDYGSLPRHLAPVRPIEATGSTYLWLDLSGAPAGAEITFVAEWESPVLFRWALVKIDQDGGEKGRVEIAGVYGNTKVQQSMVDLEGLAGLLVVGMNLGDLNRAFPYDPDEAPFAPHGYTVTLYPKQE